MDFELELGWKSYSTNGSCRSRVNQNLLDIHGSDILHCVPGSFLILCQLFKVTLSILATLVAMRCFLPAVVMFSKPSLPIGVFQSIVRMLKGLIPKQTRFPRILGGLVLSATVVSPVCCITFWEEMDKEKEWM